MADHSHLHLLQPKFEHNISCGGECQSPRLAARGGVLQLFDGKLLRPVATQDDVANLNSRRVAIVVKADVAIRNIFDWSSANFFIVERQADLSVRQFHSDFVPVGLLLCAAGVRRQTIMGALGQSAGANLQ